MPLLLINAQKGLPLRKLLGFEKELLLATMPRKQQQKLLGTTISLHWWASLYHLLDQVNFFFSKYSLFFQHFTKPCLLWSSCTPAALPLLGYIQFLGEFVEDNGGVLPLFCLVKGELPESWKRRTLPLEFSLASCENLEWSLTFLARIEKKFCFPKKL
jgi:hypothetical protein